MTRNNNIDKYLKHNGGSTIHRIMYDIKKVLLLRTIWAVGRKGNVVFSDFSKQMQALEANIPNYEKQGIPTEQMKGIISKYKAVKNPDEPHIRASLILGAIAEKKWWQIWRSKANQKERYEEYKKILQECASETPPLVDLVNSKEAMFDSGESEYEEVVRITGSGHKYSRLDVAFSRICNEHYTSALVIIAILSFLTTMNISSSFRQWLFTNWTTIQTLLSR